MQQGSVAHDRGRLRSLSSGPTRAVVAVVDFVFDFPLQQSVRTNCESPAATLEVRSFETSGTDKVILYTCTTVVGPNKVHTLWLIISSAVTAKGSKVDTLQEHVGRIAGAWTWCQEGIQAVALCLRHSEE